MNDHDLPTREAATRAPSSVKAPSTAPECVHCSFAAEHHWWGPDLAPARSHCERCHRSWASGRECHCTGCCRHFDHVNAFDAHQINGKCCDPAAATRRDGAVRFEELSRPFGKVWRIKPTRPNRFLAQQG
jgi:hypothetical protein